MFKKIKSIFIVTMIVLFIFQGFLLSGYATDTKINYPERCYRNLSLGCWRRYRCLSQVLGRSITKKIWSTFCGN